MNIFFTLLVKLIPLYIIIFLGYIAGRYLKAQKETLSALLIYLIYPVVVFTSVTTTNLTPSTLSLPVVVFLISCMLCLSFYWFAGYLWKDSTRNLLAFGAGNANTGYFGLPVALAIFNQNLIGLYILAVLGITFYENTLAFFIIAKGHHTAMDSLKKIAKLPTFYAFILGIIVSFSHIHLPQIYFDTAANFRAAFTLLGMMIVGLGLAGIKDFKFDFKFVGISFLAKFLLWPIFIGIVIFLDTHFFHAYNTSIYKLLLLASVTPLAANMVVFATQLKTHPDKAAFAVLLSTLFAIIYIPFFTAVFLQ